MHRKAVEQHIADQQISEQQISEQQTVEQYIADQRTEEDQCRNLGIRLGKYMLIRSLGQGGEGSVYLARDEHLQRFVAMKCIRRMGTDKSDADKKKEEKIIREANYLQRLEHPMLPVVYDLFEDNGSVWYLVMEYIQGVNLHEYIERNGCVQDGQARAWAEQLSDVLGYLHSRKPPVIYTDLKPDNIMVCPGGKLRLVDFGAALTRSFGADCRIMMAATPGYGAPEQWGIVKEEPQDTRKGHVRSGFYADERSDIYALGKVLYYMATGADPAKPPYTTLPIYEYQPLLGDDLEMIIRKCIMQEPEQRYQTVGEVQRDLSRSVGRRQGARRKDFIRMVEKRVWLTEGETMVLPDYKKSGYGY